MAVSVTIAHVCPDNLLVVYGKTTKYCGPDGGPGPIKAFGDASAVAELDHTEAVDYFKKLLTAAEAKLDLTPLSVE